MGDDAGFSDGADGSSATPQSQTQTQTQVEPVVLAVNIALRNYQRSVGVAARIARPRARKGDRVQWTLRLYHFEDTEQFCHLESLLIALNPAAVYLPRACA